MVEVVRVRIPVGDFTLEAEAALLPGAPGAVVCHPHPAFGGRMDNPLVLALADALSAAGLSTVRFHFRGIGASGGTATGGRAEHEDVRAVAAWLRAQGASRIALVGYSFGALMAMRALAAGETAAVYAGVAFPTSLLGDRSEVRAERVAELARALDQNLPWLFLQGDRDQFCDVTRITEAARDRPNTRVQTLPDTGHFFTGPAAQSVAQSVAEFVGDTLSPANPT